MSCQPSTAELYYQNANNLHDCGLYHEAIKAYRLAIETNPVFAPAYNNLAVTLNMCGFCQEALTACTMALLYAPQMAEAYANRGIALKGLGRFDEAEKAYRSSLAINPHQAATYSSLAGLLSGRGQITAAICAYRQALAIDPKRHEARLKLCMLFAADSAEISQYQSFEAALNELESATADDMSGFGAVVGTAQPFALAYHPGDQTALLSRYGDIVCRARNTWFQANCIVPQIPDTERNRIRLLIVSGQISNHSVWNVLLHGLLRHVDRNRFEILLYNTTAQHTAEGLFAQSLVDHYEWGPRDWIMQVLNDRPDAIYYPEIGMDTVTAQLATLRLAPLQLAGWGHPITSGLPTIDYYLSGDLIEPPDGDKHYREQLVRLPGTGACSMLPLVQPVSPDTLLSDLPSDRPIVRFLICQQAAKLDTAYDFIYPEIATNLPSCRFWFVRDNSPLWQDSIEKRLRQAFEARGLLPDDYLRFIDWLPADQFLGLLDSMDIYLDTPAFSGYTTAWQALHRGLPVVTLEGFFMRQRLATGLLRRIGLTSTVAVDIQDYCIKACHLALNPSFRMSVRTAIMESISKADEDITVVRAFEHVLLDSVRVIRRQPVFNDFQGYT